MYKGNKMKQCIKCEQLIDDDSMFCPYCGVQQPALPKEEAPQISINNPTNGPQPQYSPHPQLTEPVYDQQPQPTAPVYSQHPLENAPVYGQAGPQDVMKHNQQQPVNGPVYGQQPPQNAPMYGQQPPQTASMYGQPGAQGAMMYNPQMPANGLVYGQQPPQNASIYGQQGQQGAMMYNQQPLQNPPMYGQQGLQPVQPSAPARGGFFSKIPKPLLIVVPAVLVTLIIIVAIFSNLRGAGSSEKAIENFYNSLSAGNSKKMVSSMMPKELEKAADKAMKSGEFGKSYDSFSDALDIMFDDYMEDGFKIDRVRITEKEKLEKDEVKEFGENFTKGLNVNVKIVEAYRVKTTYRYQEKKDGDWEEDDMRFMIYKAGNRWYAMPSDIF
jgi:hypothetical protein